MNLSFGTDVHIHKFYSELWKQHKVSFLKVNQTFYSFNVRIRNKCVTLFLFDVFSLCGKKWNTQKQRDCLDHTLRIFFPSQVVTAVCSAACCCQEAHAINQFSSVSPFDHHTKPIHSLNQTRVRLQPPPYLSNLVFAETQALPQNLLVTPERVRNPVTIPESAHLKNTPDKETWFFTSLCLFNSEFTIKNKNCGYGVVSFSSFQPICAQKRFCFSLM